MRAVKSARRSVDGTIACLPVLVVVALATCALINTAAAQADACKVGYVWREANVQDHVCVTPQARAQVQQDNQLATSRLAAPGSDACKAGFVFREANVQDHVCVTSQTRAQVQQDNGVGATLISTATSAASPSPLVIKPAAPKGAPPSLPSAVGGSQTNIAPGPPLSLPVPTGLTSTLDPATCAKHGFGGALVCGTLRAGQQLALIWSFNSGARPITGFHVYRVDKGAHDLVGTQPDGEGVTLAILTTPPAAGFQTACYAVAAYDATGDGNLSAQYCPRAPLPAPTGLTATLDPTICTQHGGSGGASQCTTSLPQGALALIWSFNANGEVINGFHIYRVDGGVHELVGTQANGMNITLAVLSRPQGGFQTACYSVAAYNGSGEGSPSTQYCPSPQNFYQVASIRPDPNRILSWHYWDNSSNAGILNAGYVGSQSTLGLLYFSLHEIESKATIVSAHLKMTVANSVVGPTVSSRVNSLASCVAYVAQAANIWWTAPYTTAPEYYVQTLSGGGGQGPASPDPKSIQQPGPNVSFDVKDLMTDWVVANRPYTGFALMGIDRLQVGSDSAPHADTCLSSYQINSIVLEVIYQ